MLTESTFAAALKEKWRHGIEKAVLAKSSTLGMLDKTGFSGSSKNLVIQVSHAGASASFSVAQAQKSSATPYEFLVTLAELHVHGSIDGKTQEQTLNDGAVAQGLSTLLDEKATEFSHALSYSFWNGQGGAVGQIATGGISGSVITLEEPADHVNFNIGDRLQLSATDTSSSTARDNGNYVTVTKVGRQAGTLTVAETVTTAISGAAAADYIFKRGMVGNGAAGVFAWIPPSTSPGTLFGVDRSVDRERLAGTLYNGANGDMLSTIIQARARGRENSKDELDCLIMGSRRYADLCMALEGKTAPTRVTGKTSGGIEIGYDAIKYGSLTIMEDVFCPNGYSLITKKKGVWKLAATKSGCPHFHRDSKGAYLWPLAGADGDEFRTRGYFQFECHKPQSNVLIDWENVAGQ